MQQSTWNNVEIIFVIETKCLKKNAFNENRNTIDSKSNCSRNENRFTFAWLFLPPNSANRSFVFIYIHRGFHFENHGFFFTIILCLFVFFDVAKKKNVTCLLTEFYDHIWIEIMLLAQISSGECVWRGMWNRAHRHSPHRNDSQSLYSFVKWN